MIRLTLTSRRRRGIAIAAAAVAVLMLADVVYQIGVHVAWRRWMPSAEAAEVATTQPAATQPAGTQPAEGGKPGEDGDKAKQEEKKPAKPHELYAAIKKRDVFKQVTKESHGLQLIGVLGNLALFNKGAIAEGESDLGVKVVSIKGYEVTIEYRGKPEVMKLFGDSPGGPPPSSPSAEGGRPGRPAHGGPPPPIPVTEPSAEAMRERARGAAKAAMEEAIKARSSGGQTMIVTEDGQTMIINAPE